MSKFRGSARSSGFDAINVPDNAQRVREAGQKRIEELRRTYQQSIKNQKGAADDLQQSYAETRTALDRNISLQRTFEQTYEQALRNRYQQKIDKSKQKAELERDRYDRLSSFSKEAGKLGKKLYEEHKDNRQRDGMALVFNTGLTAEELQTLRRGEDELQSEHAATNAIIERLKARGASASEIKQIQELDGWILYGAQKELARKGGDAYRMHLQNPEVRNKKYDLGDGRKMSLQDAIESGDDVDYKTIRGIISGNFLDRYKGYDLAFAEEYLFPGMRKVNANDDLSFTSKAQERFEKEQADVYRTSVSNLLADMETDSRAVEKFLITESGNLGGAALGQERGKLLQYIAEGFVDGSLTDKRILSLLSSQEFTIGGKTVTFAEQFDKQNSKDKAYLKAITNAIRDQDKEQYDNEKFDDQKLMDELTQIAIREAEQGDGLSDAEVQEIRDKLIARGIPPSPTLQNLMIKRSLGIDSKIQYEQAVSLGQDVPLTKAQVLAKFPDLTATQVENVVNLSNSRGPNGGSGLKDYTDQLEQEIKSIMESSNKIDPGAQTVGMTRIMKKRFAEEVLQRKLDPKYVGYTYDQIAQDVLVEHTRELKNGEGIYQRLLNPDGTPVIGDGAGFVNVGAAPTVDSPRYKKVVDSVSADPKVLSNQKLLGDINDKTSWASQIPLIVESREPPLWLTELARVTNTPWKVFFNKQAAQYGDYRIPLSRLEDAAEGISPGFRRDMTTLATGTAVIMGSVRQARAQGAQGMDVYRPLLNLIASYESSNDTVHGGYDAMNLGGTHGGSRAIGSNTGTMYFKKPLIKMTVGEIMDMQAAGQLHAAGRYQFLGSTLQDVFNRGRPGGITRDSFFDAATQDKLAVTYIRMTMRDFPGDPTSGIRGRWIGVKDNLSYEETLDIVNRIQQDTRVQGTAFANYEIDSATYAHAANR